MKKILFICYGNIARSQMAQGFWNHYTNTNNSKSAGVSKDTPEMFSKPTKEAILVMEEKGIDISMQSVNFVSNDLVSWSDKIIVLTDKNDCPDLILNSSKSSFNLIEDPYGKPINKYRDIRDEIDKLVMIEVEKANLPI